MLGLGLKKKLSRLHADFQCYIKNTYLRPNLFDLKTPERVGAIYHHPSDMCETDRLMLYALIRGLKPQFVIEIGARWGGSARIIANAMEDNGIGKVVGIDPEVSEFRAKKSSLHGRYTLLKGYSPKAIPEAIELLGCRTVDFVFVDALHTHDAVREDFLGVIPFLAPHAHILLHDTYHQGINQAINNIIEDHSNLFDMGFITRHPELGDLVAYQGLRLVRVGGVDSKALIEEAYVGSTFKKPVFHDALRNYDQFANRVGLGATEEEMKIIQNLRE